MVNFTSDYEGHPNGGQSKGIDRRLRLNVHYKKSLEPLGSLSTSETLWCLQGIFDPLTFQGRTANDVVDYHKRVKAHLGHIENSLTNIKIREKESDQIRDIFHHASLFNFFGDPLKSPLLKPLTEVTNQEIASHIIAYEITGYARDNILLRVGTCEDWTTKRKQLDQRLKNFANLALFALQREDGAFLPCSGQLLKMSINNFHIPECQKLTQEILIIGHDKQHEIENAVREIGKSGVTNMEDFSKVASYRTQNSPNLFRRIGQATRLILGQ